MLALQTLGTCFRDISMSEEFMKEVRVASTWPALLYSPPYPLSTRRSLSRISLAFRLLVSFFPNMKPHLAMAIWWTVLQLTFAFGNCDSACILTDLLYTTKRNLRLELFSVSLSNVVVFPSRHQ